MTHMDEIIILVLFGYSVVITAIHVEYRWKVKERMENTRIARSRDRVQTIE